MSASIWTPGSSIIPQADPNSQIKSEPFTATEGQTTFELTQFSYTLGVGALSVFRNGVKIKNSYVTEINNTSFSISACEVGDEIEAVGNTAIADPTAILAEIIVIQGEVEVTAAEAEASAVAAAASAASVELPLPITSGGTGGITAEEARDNLGVTAELTALSGSTTASLLTKVDKTPSGKSMEVPVHTTAERDATAFDGYFGYNSDLDIFEGYQNGIWRPIGGGQMLGTALTKAIFYNAQLIDEDLTIAAGTNGFSAGPTQIAPGRTVTVSPGSTWKII